MAIPKTQLDVNNLDLSYMGDKWSQDMVRDGMGAIIRLNDKMKRKESTIDVWDYLSKYIPEEGKGFMFSSDPIVSQIINEMEIGHSGSTVGWTMRQLELIVKSGLTAHRSRYMVS
jgi:hypothetical protein